MKILFNLALGLFISLSAFAQNTETRAVSNFTKLSIGVAADVRLTKGPFKLTLEGDDLDEIETTVKGNQLVIKNKNNDWSIFGNDTDDVTIHISMPALEGVSVSGSGKLESEDQFTSKTMKIQVSGSGDVILNVVADRLETHVSGSGEIQTAGSAQDFEAHISGSGKVRGQEMRAQTVDVHISGSGDCYIHADKTIEAHISGSGNVSYTGNPTNVNARTSGSGKVTKRG